MSDTCPTCGKASRFGTPYYICEDPFHQPAASVPQTRFDEFDDEDHPFNKWWKAHGQYMMSGGGRRESIWAARGWIAREQLMCGAEVTGESLNESMPVPSVPEPAKQPAEIARALREAQDRIKAIIDGSQYAEDNDLDICHICRPGIDHRHEEGCPILAAERFMMKQGDTQ